MSDEKIELHAIYRKNGSIEIRDQHGRGIEDRQARVIVDVTLEAPHWPTDSPHVEIRIRVPLEVEERLPEWMREHLVL